MKLTVKDINRATKGRLLSVERLLRWDGRLEAAEAQLAAEWLLGLGWQHTMRRDGWCWVPPAGKHTATQRNPSQPDDLGHALKLESSAWTAAALAGYGWRVICDPVDGEREFYATLQWWFGFQMIPPGRMRIGQLGECQVARRSDRRTVKFALRQTGVAWIPVPPSSEEVASIVSRTTFIQ